VVPRGRPMRRWLVRIFLVAIILSAAFAVWLIIPGSPITEANCDRIQTGMTEREVEEILGGPTTETLQWLAEDVDKALTKYWGASDAGIAVYFDADGRVFHKHFAVIAPRPVWWRILHWFGIQPPPPEVEA
jgi:hypothetical protein